MFKTMRNTLGEFLKLSRQVPKSRASTDLGSLLRVNNTKGDALQKHIAPLFYLYLHRIYLIVAET